MIAVPRMEVLDCGTSQVLGTASTGHGKECRNRPGRIFSGLYCVCECHQPLVRWPWRRRR